MQPKNLLSDFNKVASPEYKSTQTNENIQSIQLNEKEVSTKSKRCTCCNKKTGLMGFNCRCGGNFCANHRHADQHNCKEIESFKKTDIEVLKKQNEKVVADKLEKI
jgi:predicted nucleic acid binding AN1-type Zn finger protein